MILVNWWDILKVQQTLNVGQQPVWQEGQSKFNVNPPLRQPISAQTPTQQLTLNQVKGSPRTGQTQQLIQPTNESQTISPELKDQYAQLASQQMPIDNKEQGVQTELGQNLNPTQQVNTTQNIPQDASGGESGGEDDSDVGEVRENVSRAKQNLTQLPRGPKARILTQVLTDLSAAAIDPVNQRQIAIDAKNKLQDAFPAQS